MSKRDKKREKRIQIILTVLIVFLMTSSIIGFMWGGSDEDTLEYDEHKFYRKGSGFALKIDNNEARFDYFPTSVTNINMSSEIIKRLQNTKQIDSTYDQNDSNVESIAAAQYNMNQILGTIDNTYVRSGFTENSSYNLPIITCSDSTPFVPVIYFKTSNETKIELVGDCIIASARFVSDFARIKDRLLFSILGIIK